MANIALYMLYRKYYALRTRAKRLLLPENYVVMVREVDTRLSEADIAAVFEGVFGRGCVHSVQRAYRTPAIWKAIAEREKIGLKLETALAYPFHHDGQRQQVRQKPIFGAKVDAIEHYRTEFDALSALIASRQAQAARDDAVAVRPSFTQSFCSDQATPSPTRAARTQRQQPTTTTTQHNNHSNQRGGGRKLTSTGVRSRL